MHSVGSAAVIISLLLWTASAEVTTRIENSEAAILIYPQLIVLQGCFGDNERPRTWQLGLLKDRRGF